MHDQNFLDIHPCKTAGKISFKAASILTKSKKAFQKAADQALTQKTTTGDLAPKPASNVIFAMAEEGTSLLIKLGPQLMRMANSPASLSLGLAACTVILMLDDTTRNMAMDQISQFMALFQNEAADSKTENPKPPKAEL